MIIAQISDSHLALDTPDSKRRIEDFEATIEHINELDPAPDLIIHTGDIVQNGRVDEYQRAAEILQMARVPVYVMVGNKDDRRHLRSTLPAAFYNEQDGEFVAYSLEDFPVRLIALDTLNPGSNKGEFCQQRLSDLVNVLEADTKKPVAIFAHHPPIRVLEGPDPIHFETEEIMQRFRQTLQQFPKITSLFCGHVHRGVAGSIGDIPCLVMPCISTSLRRGDYPTELTTCPIYHLHKYEPDWGFTTEIQIVRSA